MTDASGGATDAARDVSGAASDAARDAPGTREAAPDGADATLPDCSIPPTPADQPTLLSRTGCVDPSHPTQPAAGWIPYDVISRLWSDGAEKHRYLLLPPGGRIHVKNCADAPETCGPDGGTPEDEGHFDFPVGTLLMKTFALGGRLIETRFLMHLDADTWRGFSYEWNDAETEATLLGDGKDRQVAGQTWHYPSRAQCLQCHTRAAGRSLGPSTRQLDTDFAYDGGTNNQLDELAARGLFDGPLPSIPPYPDPSATDAASLEARARAYLAVNCSICHRPGGSLDDVDLRYATPFAETRLCNEPVERGTGDPALPQIRLVPGSPDQSSLSFRMHDLGPYRMPKIGSSVVDPVGTATIDDWIESLAGCGP